MFAKQVECAFWKERCGKRNAKVIYVFDDGFDSFDKVKKALADHDCNVNYFRYVKFCNYWFAVYVFSHRRRIVLSKEAAKGSIAKYNIPDKIEFKQELFLRPSVPDVKKWTDGIIHDLILIDPDIEVFCADGNKEMDPIMINNILNSFGIPYFASELCIRMDSYINNVFYKYFSIGTMYYMEREIIEARKGGAQYFNPFTKETSKNYKEQYRKIIDKCGGSIPECIMNPCVNGKKIYNIL